MDYCTLHLSTVLIYAGRNQLKDLLNDLVLQTTEENRFNKFNPHHMGQASIVIFCRELSPFEVDEDVEEAAREL